MPLADQVDQCLQLAWNMAPPGKIERQAGKGRRPFVEQRDQPTGRDMGQRAALLDIGQPSAIDGQLTIKGVTKPVTLKVNHFAAMAHPMLKKDAIGANASTVIKRSEFNAGKYAPGVGDEVTITVSLEAVAK